jgi:hypothetical protein
MRRAGGLAVAGLLAIAVVGCADDGGSDPAAVVDTTTSTTAVPTTTTTTGTTTTASGTTGTTAVGAAVDVDHLEQVVAGAETLADELDADVAGDTSSG